MPGINVQYNGSSIQTNNIIVSNIRHDSVPGKVQNKFALARTNKSTVTNVQYPERTITISGQVIGSNIADLEQRIDDFKLLMTPSANVANLDIDYNAGTRRYLATISSVTIDRNETLFSVDYSIEFTCLMPWGIDTTTSTLINAATITANNSSQSLTIGGNAPDQPLTITYVLNSFTGTAANTVYLKNNATGQQITINRTWVAGDSLVIDQANLSVKVNGTEVDYGGVFPAFALGAGTLVVSDNWTARNVTFTVTQVKRWL